MHRKKSYLYIALPIILTLVFVGFVSTNRNKATIHAKQLQTYSQSSVQISIPSSWTIEKTDAYFSPNSLTWKNKV